MTNESDIQTSDELVAADTTLEANKEDQGEVAAAASLDDRKPKSKSKKDTPPPPAVLFDYLAELYKGRNFNKVYKKAFDKIDLESRLTTEQQEELLEFSREGDKENKTLIALSDFLLEGQGGKSVRDSVMRHIEYVVSHEGNLSKTQQTSIFQAWVDRCEFSNRVSFVTSQIDQIKDGVDKSGKPKPLPDGRKNVLKCIAAIWLFYKGYADLKQILKELSRDTFGIDGVASESVERRALGFAARMVGSTNREGFAFFLNHLNRQQTALANDLSHSRAREEASGRKNQTLTEELSLLQQEALDSSIRIQELSNRIADLEGALSKSKEQASHQGIHQRDELHALKGKIANFLEQEVALLRSASAANSRNPPKTKVVDIKLDDALQGFEEKIKWLKQ